MCACNNGICQKVCLEVRAFAEEERFLGRLPGIKCHQPYHRVVRGIIGADRCPEDPRLLKCFLVCLQCVKLLHMSIFLQIKDSRD